MPPRIVKLFTLGGTDYTLNWLPLGGFVRPLGEDMVRQMGDEALEEDREEAERRGIAKDAVRSTKRRRWRAFSFWQAGALANFLLAFVLFVIIALMGIPQVVGGVVSLNYIAPDSALAQAGLQTSDVIQTINGENFTDAADLLNRLNAANGQPVTLGVVRGDQQTPLDVTVNSGS